MATKNSLRDAGSAEERTQKIVDLAKRVASFHGRVEGMIVATLHGPGFPNGPNGRSSRFAETLAYNLNVFWFALMVGWSGGLHSRDDVIERMETVAAMLLCAAAEGSA